MLPRLYPNESAIRKRQINTLKIFNENVAEVQADCEYIVFFNSGGKELRICVILSKDFPNDKPILRISPIVSHPWVSPEGEITGAPGLLNFTVHSDLGRVVQAIVREYERTPPPLASDQTESTSSSASVPVTETDAMGRASPRFALNCTGLHSVSPPTQSSFGSTVQSIAFPDLNSLSLDELTFLYNNGVRQEEFLDNLSQIKEMNVTVDDLIVQIEELAESSLAKEERLKALKETVNAKIEDATKLAFENERLNVTYQMLSEKYSPRNIKEQLCQAAQKADIESERLADAFLNGHIDVDKFLSMYIQSRTVSQTRKTKEEKLSRQIQNLEKAGF